MRPPRPRGRGRTRGPGAPSASERWQTPQARPHASLRMRVATVESFDGTRIAYRVVGEGPPLVLANGIGVGHEGFAHQTARFRQSHRVILWDYRGSYRSEPARTGDYSVPIQARDLAAILDAEGIERACFLGWSMGVQVNLELYRLRPRVVAGMVALNGTCGSPFATAFNLPGMRRAIPAVLGVIRDHPFLADRLMRLGPRLPGFVKAMKLLGWVSPSADEALLEMVAKGVVSQDKTAYFSTLIEIGRHDASDLLAGIDFPLLVIAGGRDFFTPTKVAEKMHRAVRGSELAVLPGGSHYCLFEMPQAVNERAEEFFARHPFDA